MPSTIPTTHSMKPRKNTKGCRLGWSKSWVGQAEDPILQVSQLTELKQTMEWERCPNQFQQLYDLYETLLPENLGKHCHWITSRGNSHAIILTDSISLLQKVKSRMESPVKNCQCPTSTFLNSCGCTALDKLESKETSESID